MALFLWSDPYNYSRPSQILDQQFGCDLESEDLLTPSGPPSLLNFLRSSTGYLRSWRSSASEKDTGSSVKCDEDQFQANLDVQQFKPEEITVKATENVVTVEGKHEEKKDEHGFIFRHFVRKYLVPKGHDLGKIESKLSSDGVLTITALRNNMEEEEERRIPVVQTGQPSNSGEEG